LILRSWSCDEVLAVGDAEFQKKCLSKMSGIAHGGRTILFVSHNMGAVNRLCDHGVWLDKGGVVMQGKCGDTVRAYLSAGNSGVAERVWEGAECLERWPPPNASAHLSAARMSATFVDITEPFDIEIETHVETPEAETGVGFYVLTPDGGVCDAQR